MRDELLSNHKAGSGRVSEVPPVRGQARPTPLDHVAPDWWWWGPGRGCLEAMGVGGPRLGCMVMASPLLFPREPGEVAQ